MRRRVRTQLEAQPRVILCKQAQNSDLELSESLSCPTTRRPHLEVELLPPRCLQLNDRLLVAALMERLVSAAMLNQDIQDVLHDLLRGEVLNTIGSAHSLQLAELVVDDNRPDRRPRRRPLVERLDIHRHLACEAELQNQAGGTAQTLRQNADTRSLTADFTNGLPGVE